MGEDGSSGGRAQWLLGGRDPLYSVLHTPEAGVAQQPTAVLMLPPFGWDAMVSHRARRRWAVRLAQAGFRTLRIDLPGTDESDGDAHLPDLVDRWTQASIDAAEWLRSQDGTERLAVAGVGLGGLIACRALAAGAPIDDLILWAVPGRGRSAVRELVAYAGVVASEFPEDAAGPGPEDGVDVTGYLLSRTSMAALSAIDVAALDLPAGAGRRALLLSRDDLGVDDRLSAALEATGIAVETVTVEDYSRLMAHPESVDPRRPEATITRSIEWLGRAPAGGGQPADAAGGAGAALTVSDEAIVHSGGVAVRETIVRLDIAGEPGVAVISEPLADVSRAPFATILLNSGSLRKSGPHRLWVEVARRWAARGVVTLRADFGSVGDAVSAGDHGADEGDLVSVVMLTRKAMIDAVGELADVLSRRGLADRFVAVGHCSGAYLGFRHAVNDPRIAGVFGVNLQAFHFDDHVYQERMLEKITAAARQGLVHRIVRQGVRPHEVRQVLEAVRFRARRALNGAQLAAQRDGGEMLDRLRDRGTRMVLLFSQGEPMHARLFAPEAVAEAQRRWPNASFEELPTRDHMARAIWIQQATEARLDAALEDLLERVEARPAARQLSPAG